MVYRYQVAVIRSLKGQKRRWRHEWGGGKRLMVLAWCRVQIPPTRWRRQQLGNRLLGWRKRRGNTKGASNTSTQTREENDENKVEMTIVRKESARHASPLTTVSNKHEKLARLRQSVVARSLASLVTRKRKSDEGVCGGCGGPHSEKFLASWGVQKLNKHTKVLRYGHSLHSRWKCLQLTICV